MEGRRGAETPLVPAAAAHSTVRSAPAWEWGQAPGNHGKDWKKQLKKAAALPSHLTMQF